jgi:hypothetical protein
MRLPELRQTQSNKGAKRASVGNLAQTTTDDGDIQFGAKLVF